MQRLAKIPALLLVLNLLGALSEASAKEAPRIRIEMWEGCLCDGSIHSRSYAQLAAERPGRMLFGVDATVSEEDLKARSLRALLEKHLANNPLKSRIEFYYQTWYAGSIRKVKTKDLKDGDLLIYFKEAF
jgi:hypothetical protein